MISRFFRYVVVKIEQEKINNTIIEVKNQSNWKDICCLSIGLNTMTDSKTVKNTTKELDSLYKFTELLLKLTIGSAGGAFGIMAFSDKFTDVKMQEGIYGILGMVATGLICLLVLLVLVTVQGSTDEKGLIWALQGSLASAIILYIGGIIHYVSALTGYDTPLINMLLGIRVFLVLIIIFGLFWGIPRLIIRKN